MADQAAVPLKRVAVQDTSQVGVHPMSGMMNGGQQLGDNVAGNPTTLAQGAPGRKPDWYRHAGGNAPSSGMMGAVPLPGVSLEGPPAAAAMTPSPDMPIDVMGMRTNPSAPYARIARRLKHPLMDAPQKYQIILTQREATDPVLKRKNREARRYTMLNVPALNFYLARTAAMPRTPADVKSALSILDMWSFDGIVRTEEGKMEQYFWKEDVGAERLFNNVVRGYAHTFNVFGPNARPGTRLFLIIKKVQMAKDALFNVKPYEKTGIPVGNANVSPIPFQIGFFGDYNYDKPPVKVLEYKDEFGHRHIGSYIYIGRVSTHAPVLRDYRDVGRCSQDLSSILLQPHFHVHVDY
jgi:hypothetical protein